jgi:hypothetical protein
MRFAYQQVLDLTDATRNFEQIQSAFGFPVYSAPPSNPKQGQAYFDTSLHQIGVWTGAAWHYV